MLQVVAAAVEHAMEATRGHRELHARYEGDPASAGSMHDAGPTGRTHLQEAKAAAEARGEHVFAKPDHLGIQVCCRNGLAASLLMSVLAPGASSCTRLALIHGSIPETMHTSTAKVTTALGQPAKCAR